MDTQENARVTPGTSVGVDPDLKLLWPHWEQLTWDSQDHGVNHWYLPFTNKEAVTPVAQC